uniref:Uncharacterized protein n=1 Tax=Anguilla anguilla TaxID=7936 RepID=A0A0E9QGE9_ANGAN
MLMYICFSLIKTKIALVSFLFVFFKKTKISQVRLCH